MAGKPKDAGRDTTLTLRMPRELHDRIIQAAGERSVSEEIRRRLESSLAGVPSSADPMFADLLAAIGHAAAAAGRMFPSPKPGDTTKYEAFVEAAHTLMVAFAPDGRPAVTQEQGFRFAYQLVGMALGALGERGAPAFARLPEIDQD